jgi:hypothetical protein
VSAAIVESSDDAIKLLPVLGVELASIVVGDGPIVIG